MKNIGNVTVPLSCSFFWGNYLWKINW